MAEIVEGQIKQESGIRCHSLFRTFFLIDCPCPGHRPPPGNRDRMGGNAPNLPIEASGEVGENLDGLRGERDAPLLSVLCFGENRCPFLEIDKIPYHSRYFFLPHRGLHRKPGDRGEKGRFRCGENPLQLSLFQPTIPGSGQAGVKREKVCPVFRI